MYHDVYFNNLRSSLHEQLACNNFEVVAGEKRREYGYRDYEGL